MDTMHFPTTIRELCGRGLCATCVLPFLVMETIELCGHWITAKTQRLHGKMPKEEFRQLTEVGERLTSEICRGIIPEHGCERCWAFCDEGEKSLVSIQWVFPPKPIMTP